MTARVLRTTVDDDLFIRMDAALGIPVVNQMVWRLRDLPDRDELDRFAAAVARGRIARLLRRSRIPIVRDHWVTGGAATGGIVVEDSAVAADATMAWIDAAASRPFDLVHGPVWEVRAAPLAGSGGIVSLCLSHAVGDGAAALAAFADALAGDVDGLQAGSPSGLDQLREAIGRTAAVAGAVGAIVRDRLRDDPDAGSGEPDVVTAARSTALPPTAAERGPALAPFSVISVDTADWERVAAAGGGSSNALFVAVVVGLVVAAGRAGRDDVVRVSVPMSTRTPGDVRANATVGLSLDVPAAAALDGDLATIRRLAKEVYTARTSRPSTLLRLQPVMQILGDRVIAAVARNATTPLALSSNLGRIDPVVAGFGDPARADAVVTRSTTQAVTTARLRSMRGGLAAWVNDAAGTTTLSVVGLDPDGLGPDVLDDAVCAELRRRDLVPRPW